MMPVFGTVRCINVVVVWCISHFCQQVRQLSTVYHLIFAVGHIIIIRDEEENYYMTNSKEGFISEILQSLDYILIKLIKSAM